MGKYTNGIKAAFLAGAMAVGGCRGYTTCYRASFDENGACNCLRVKCGPEVYQILRDERGAVLEKARITNRETGEFEWVRKAV